MIFVDCYADWCGPCKQLASQVFTQKEVGDVFNSHFVNVQFNVEKDADGKVISGLVDGNEVVNKNWTEAWQNDWFDGGDGWYYYKKVLPANEMTAKVLTSLKFDSNYAEIYQTADYTLKFVSEAVQYSDDDSVNHRAVQANFGRDFKVISNNVITWN